MYLTAEEEEIVRRYRKLPEAKKRTVLASERSFIQWLKDAVSWVWEKIKDFAATEVIRSIYETLKDMFFNNR